MSRSVKIAITLGPATDPPGVLESLLEAGANVARLNYSHGTHAAHKKRARQLRRAAKKVGCVVSLLADLQGPRFRLGELPHGERTIAPGEKLTLEAGGECSNEDHVPVALPELAQTVKKGHRILIDDGRIELVVDSIKDNTVKTTVIQGGVLGDRKGLNLPDGAPNVPALTQKDRADLKNAIEVGADWLAISFVKDGADIQYARRQIKKHGVDLPILAKIERPEAVDSMDSLLKEADGILVARGDLGVELPTEKVPIIQKSIIEIANSRGVPVMTATQMLDSMRHEPRPTRAEATDVANAVMDGSGCLLLTAETAVGEYPVESVSTMAAIVREAEKSGRTFVPDPTRPLSVAAATCLAAVKVAAEVKAKWIIAYTGSGFTARQVARFRPKTSILAYTPHAQVQRKLALIWGVTPKAMGRRRNVDALIQALDQDLLTNKLAKKGDLIVVLTGSPIGLQGSTNLMQVHAVGELPGRADTPRVDRRRRRRPV